MTDKIFYTLAEAQDYWMELIENDGGQCPCCSRFGKIYGRNINDTMARSLIWLVQESAKTNSGWVNVAKKAPRWLVASNQLPTLRWWDMIEREPSEDITKKHSGVWRPTSKGIAFSENRLFVPKTVFTYDGHVIRFGEKTTSIESCFGKKFNYQEVMSMAASGEWKSKR